jgi:hypothetical protein
LIERLSKNKIKTEMTFFVCSFFEKKISKNISSTNNQLFRDARHFKLKEILPSEIGDFSFYKKEAKESDQKQEKNYLNDVTLCNLFI